MSLPLFSVMSAAALAATGIGATGETRSAQSLPAQNLALVQMPGGSAGKLHAVRHLTADTAEPSDEGNCKNDGGHWDDKRLRCVKGGWWFNTGSRLLIGAGTVLGIVLAVSDSGNASGSSQPVSN